jgi:predicted phage terminase large subunit-like protein
MIPTRLSDPVEFCVARQVIVFRFRKDGCDLMLFVVLIGMMEPDLWPDAKYAGVEAGLKRYQVALGRTSYRHVVLSCDPAGKAGVLNDYTAITIAGVSNKELHLLHVVRGHWTVLQMRDQIVALAQQWKPDLVIIEDTSSGMGLIQLLREQSWLSIVGRHPKDDKETRMSRHQGRFEAGRLSSHRPDGERCGSTVGPAMT